MHRGRAWRADGDAQVCMNVYIQYQVLGTIVPNECLSHAFFNSVYCLW